MNAATDVIDRAIQIASQSLGDVASGAVLYSGRASLRPSPVYVMGFNPGGNPNEHPRSVAEDLALTRDKVPANWCSYTDLEWDRPKGQSMGLRPHQRNFLAFAAALSVKPSDIPAANAIFRRTQSASEVDEQTEFARCWPIHAFFLSVVRPVAIVCIGNGRYHSSFACVAGKFRSQSAHDPFAPPFREGRSFLIPELSLAGDTPLIDVLVVGLPHFSRFAFNPELKIIEHLKQRISKS